MPFDVDAVRQDFPMLNKKMNGKRFVYLDTAATAQKPKCVVDSISNFYLNEYATVHRSIYEHSVHATESYLEVRGVVQKFIGAAYEDEIVFTKGTTESINLVAFSYAREFLRRGDEILISAMEHHANIVPWQLVCKEIGAKLVVAPIDSKGDLILTEFDKLLTSNTKVVSICHMSNSLGTINPIKEIVDLAHRKGAVVFVDGAQAAPHLEVDVQNLGVDFYAFSSHKIYGPTGVGVLYGRQELLAKMPPFLAGGDMIQEVTFEKTTFQEAPLKFEAGTPSIAEVIGFGCALNYLNKIDKKAAKIHEEKLLHKATERLQEIPGVKIFGRSNQKGPLVSFLIEGVHTLDLGTLLSLKGIALRTGSLCAQPTLHCFGYQTLARISFGLYSSIEEIDICIEALKETSALLI